MSIKPNDFPAAENTDARIIAILGMHRSGTSWLTGELQELGLELGHVNTKAKYNARGNRESPFLMRLHDEVLGNNGGSWRAPNFPNNWTAEQSARLCKFVASMSSQHDIWGFKDPRAVLLLTEWKKRVHNLTRVGIYRHPRSVYQSLHHRNPDFTEQEALRLWRIYNECLLSEHRRTPFPLIRFDVIPDALAAQLAELVRTLKLPSSSQSKMFFDQHLVHNRGADAPIPEDVKDVWDALEQRRLLPTG